MILKTTTALIASFVAVFLPTVESSSPFIVADDRVRSLDISPVLGRGYSIMTNTFMSTCLVVEQTTVPSFNYDCKFQGKDVNSRSPDVVEVKKLHNIALWTTNKSISSN